MTNGVCVVLPLASRRMFDSVCYRGAGDLGLELQILAGLEVRGMGRVGGSTMVLWKWLLKAQLSFILTTESQYAQHMSRLV